MHRKVDFARTLIFGNSGSGKSWLAEELSKRLGSPAIDLDAIHWEQNGYKIARDKQFAIAMVTQLSENETWIIEASMAGWRKLL